MEGGVDELSLIEEARKDNEGVKDFQPAREEDDKENISANVFFKLKPQKLHIQLSFIYWE